MVREEVVTDTYQPYANDPSNVQSYAKERKFYDDQNNLVRVERYDVVKTGRNTDYVRLISKEDYSGGVAVHRHIRYYDGEGKLRDKVDEDLTTGERKVRSPSYEMKAQALANAKARTEARKGGGTGTTSFKPGTIVSDPSGRVVKADSQFSGVVGRVLSPAERRALSAGAISPQDLAQRPTTRQEFATSLFSKQGKSVEQTEGGFEFVEGEKKTTYTQGVLAEGYVDTTFYPGQLAAHAEKIREKEIQFSYPQKQGKTAEYFFGIRQSEEPQFSEMSVADIGLMNKKDSISERFAKSTTMKWLPSWDTLTYESEKALRETSGPKRAKKFVDDPLVKFQGGAYEEVRQKPLKAAAFVAVGFFTPPVVGGLGYVGSYIPAAVTTSKVVRYGGTALKWGLPAGWAAIKGLEVYTAPGGERAAKAGSIFGGEVLPILAGGYAGVKVWPKVYGYFTTQGRTEIPVENLVPENVLSGEKRFPEAPPSKHLEMFRSNIGRLPGQEKPIMFHATSEKIRPVVGAGSSELRGMYGGSDISVNFLRIDSGEGYNLFGSVPTGTPKAAAITPKGFKAGSYKRVGGGYEWTTNLEKGVAYVPGMKTEVEAVLPEGTDLVKTGGEFFFRYKGVRVPIDTYNVGQGGSFVVSGGGISSVGGSSISFSLPDNYPILSPSSFVGSLGVSSLLSESKSKSVTSRSSSGKASSSLLSSTKRSESKASRVSLKSSFIRMPSSRIVPGSSYVPGSSPLSSGGSGVSRISYLISRVGGGSSYVPPPSRIIVPPPPRIIVPPPNVPPLPKPKRGGKQKKKKSDVVGLDYFKDYRPDVTALFYKQKGKKPSEFSIGAGLARPIVNGGMKYG